MPQTARIAPAQPPYPPAIEAKLAAVMPPGIAPLTLFRILARDERLFARFMAGGLLDKGHLTLRQREIMIHRVTARCGCEYEWGVHAALFGERTQLGPEQLRSLVHGGPKDAGWSAEEALIIALADGLHDTCDVDEARWLALRGHFTEAAILELLMLAGFYRTVSMLSNALRIPLESFAKRFPA